MSTAVFPTTSEVVAIRPGDRAAAAAGTGWLQEYAATRDPALWERIILAYLGLADRLAMRYRHSRGTSCSGRSPARPTAAWASSWPTPGPGRSRRTSSSSPAWSWPCPTWNACSQMHVSRLMRRALARMRAELLVP